MRESFCEIPFARVSTFRNFRQLQPKAFPLHLVNAISRNKLYFYEGSKKIGNSLFVFRQKRVFMQFRSCSALYCDEIVFTVV